MADTDTQDQSKDSKDHDKAVEIVVNGRQKVVTTKELSYDQVVRLAFDNPFQTPQTIYTVTYKRGEGSRPDGSLVAGESTKVKAGMIFNVTATTQS